MPFQRLLTVYLAAFALWTVLDWAAGALPGRWGSTVDLGLLAATGVLLVAYLAPAVPAPPNPADPTPPAAGLYPVARAAVPQQADLEAAIRAADAAAAPGTAILVLGSDLSWHQQLWAPLWTDRPLFYDDWLWYWNPFHAGPPGYVPGEGNSYPPASVPLTLERDYLDRHAIGAVVATGAARADADAAPDLAPLRQGDAYGAWIVRDPTTIVTFGDRDAARIELGNGRLVAGGASDGGTALIRRNWFPRWHATVNGISVPITRTADNSMTVPVPAGPVRLELDYDVDAFDWAARAAAAVGILAVVAVAARPRKVLRDGMGAATGEGTVRLAALPGRLTGGERADRATRRR